MTLPDTDTHWSERDLVRIQRQAHERKKETGKKLGHCYEQVAQEWGFLTYAALRAAVKEGKEKGYGDGTHASRHHRQR